VVLEVALSTLCRVRHWCGYYFVEGTGQQQQQQQPRHPAAGSQDNRAVNNCLTDFIITPKCWYLLTNICVAYYIQ